MSAPNPNDANASQPQQPISPMPPSLSPEQLTEIANGLRDSSAKRREGTIRRYQQMPERDDRIAYQLQEMAQSDPVDYVRAAARAALATKPPAAMIADPTLGIPTGLSIELRKNILANEIQKYIKDGFRVQSQTDTTAQLVKPKRLSCLLAVILLLLMVLPFLIYIIWFAAQKDEQVYIEVDENGKVKTTKHKG